MDLPSRPKPAPWTPPGQFPGVIQTPRLVLREIGPDETDAYVRLVNSDREQLLPWTPWVRTDPLTAAETRRRFAERLEKRAADPTTPLHMGYFERVTGELIGASSIHALDQAAASANAGWWVAGTHTGRGIASEAIAHLISHALTSQDAGGWGLIKLHFDTAGTNTASRAVARRLGLRLEMHRRHHVYIDGIGLDDVYGWGVLVDEWDTGNHSIRRGEPDPLNVGSSAT